MHRHRTAHKARAIVRKWVLLCEVLPKSEVLGEFLFSAIELQLCLGWGASHQVVIGLVVAAERTSQLGEFRLHGPKSYEFILRRRGSDGADITAAGNDKKS